MHLGSCISYEDITLCLVHGLWQKLGRVYPITTLAWVVLACLLEDRITDMWSKTQKGLSLSFAPHHPKVYHWPFVTRLPAKPFSPSSSFSYFRNLTTAAHPAPPSETRRNQRGSTHGQPLLLGLGLQHAQHPELIRNADSVLTRSPGDLCAHLGLRSHGEGDTWGCVMGGCLILMSEGERI